MKTTRPVFPPRLVLYRQPGALVWAPGWLMRWERRDPGGSWYGLVRPHGHTEGGDWIPADQLRPHDPTPDELRTLGAYPAGPDGEPLTD